MEEYNFDKLLGYFANTTVLAWTLGWDETMVAEWHTHNVAKPHKTKIRQVLLLVELCNEARAYLSTDTDVGAWVNQPLPDLHESTPAQWIQIKGVAGLRELTYGMADWMPKTPNGELEPIDEDAAIAAMLATSEKDEGVREFRRMLASLKKEGA
jgi:hypothetical protein